MMDRNLVVVAAFVFAAILALGLVTAPVFADSTHIKVQQKANNHVKCGNDFSASPCTAASSQTSAVAP